MKTFSGFWKKSFAVTLLKVGFVIVVSVYLGELCLRLICRQGLMPDIYEYDRNTFYRLKPHLELRHETDDFAVTICTDSHGWRTDCPTSRYTPGARRRALFLGDSMTFGWGVENGETFVSLVGQALRRSGVDDVEVVNLATPSFSSCASSARFRREGGVNATDFVFPVIFLGNDFDENGLQYLYRRSPFFSRFGTQTLQIGLALRHNMLAAVGRYNSLVPGDLELKYLPYNGAIVLTGLFHAFTLRRPPSEQLAAIEQQVTFACVNDLHRAAMAAGVEPVFIILDARLDESDDVDRGAPSGRGLREDALVRYFSRKGFHYINLKEKLQGLYPEMTSLPQFPKDGHFTPEGHRMIAEVLLDPILKTVGGGGVSFMHRNDAYLQKWTKYASGDASLPEL